MGRDELSSRSIPANNGEKETEQCCDKNKRNNKKCCGEEKEEKRTETSIIVKGNWEHIQEAVGKEFETQTETVHQCEDCKEKGESKSGKETEKKIESCGEYIVIQHARWDEAGENWKQNTKQITRASE